MHNSLQAHFQILYELFHTDEWNCCSCEVHIDVHKVTIKFIKINSTTCKSIQSLITFSKYRQTRFIPIVRSFKIKTLIKMLLDFLSNTDTHVYCE